MGVVYAERSLTRRKHGPRFDCCTVKRGNKPFQSTLIGNKCKRMSFFFKTKNKCYYFREEHQRSPLHFKVLFQQHCICLYQTRMTSFAPRDYTSHLHLISQQMGHYRLAPASVSKRGQASEDILNTTFTQ